MNNKKEVRKNFRDQVFKRDKFCCVICGLQADRTEPEILLDSHHIVDRHDMPNGGYVKENGISLCKGENGNSCHEKAERGEPGYSAQELFDKIGSSLDLAIEASEKLK